MTPEQRHEQFAREYAKHEGKNGHIEIDECARCGALAWRSTRTLEPFGWTVRPMVDCTRCQEVLHRAPEIALWVVDVVEHAIERSKKEPT
jgi:hypothetical protein